MLFELASSFIYLESSLQSSGVNSFINIALGYCDFNSPLWFLPCFFITEIILWIVQKIQAHIGNKFLIYCVIGSFALCLMWPYMNEREIFWNAHTAVFLLPFAVLGRISSIWLNDRNVSIKTTGVATFLLGTGGVTGVYLNTQIGYLGCCYGNCLFFYLAAICSIYGICILSKKRSLGKNMKFLGRNTMSVLVMHKFLIMILLLLQV